MDLYARIEDFIDSLAKYPPKDYPDGQVADIFNALLAEVKKEHGDDPIVAAIRPAEKGAMIGGSAMDAGSLITAARQLLGAVPKPSQAPLVA